MVLVSQVKIGVPQLPPEFLRRPRLCADLDAEAASDVVLICAPAGYGKTMLLADWARTSGTDVAWVGIDHNDNDPKRLWSAILAAVAGALSVPPTSSLYARRTWQPAGRPEFITEFAAALQEIGQSIRLILDDVHELVDPQVLDSIRTFIRVKPATVQLVLASRLDPPLSLPRLRLAGRLWDLRAAHLSFTPQQTAVLLEKWGLRLSSQQVDLLHRLTGGWPAGLRLAALGMAESGDYGAFLSQFSGNDRSVADYLVGEILSGLPEHLQDFLRVASICDPMPVALAAELSGRDEAGSVLEELERRTSLVTATGSGHEVYRIQELLRTHLVADLQRHGLHRMSGLHAVSARWWADQDEPVQALEHAGQSHDEALLANLLRQFAVRLLLAGDHGPLRRALAGVGAQARAADPWLSLVSALTHLATGERSAAQSDVRQAQQFWPMHASADLGVLRAVAEQFGAGEAGSTPSAVADIDELHSEPELEALARLGRGRARLRHNDRAAACADFGAALNLSRLHGFDHLTMECLALLGVVAGISGDLRTMRAVSNEALVIAAGRGWEASPWSKAAVAMTGYSDLLRCMPVDAERCTADALATGPVWSALSRFILQSVHGAAVFDLGDRAAGLSELQRARAELGDNVATGELAAAMAMLEFRAALILGHAALAQTVLGWLTERTAYCAELVLMRAWAEAAEGRQERARSLTRVALDSSTLALLPHTVVDGWLSEASIAVAAGERLTARHALRTALTVAEPLDCVRPFAQTSPCVHDLLAHEPGSFGASEGFVNRVLAVGPDRERQGAMLSEREITVLGLLPSMLSLEEIALDLMVSPNTVKSHVRSIYIKLDVSSRRLAVLAAHERGLLSGLR